MSEPIRILVADDSQSVRRAITMLLAAELKITVCGEVSTYSELLEKIGELDPRVVLMDLHMSDERNFDCDYVRDQLRRSRLLAGVDRRGDRQSRPKLRSCAVAG
jgi:DNA-binding NarL/FixJ family response regulator